MRAAIRAALLACLAGDVAVSGQTPAERSGQQLYSAACAACHGQDGKGVARSVVGFDTPLPDFSECSFATREPDADWMAIAHQGGPVRAFDRMMPAFGEALPVDDLQRILDHVRGFCRDRAWPRGELNLPRPLVTEKAYPEDEAVVTVTAARGDLAAVSTAFLFERRFGPRNQFEIAVPLTQQRHDGAWQRGLGDVAVAVKRALVHGLGTGTIVSGAAELVLPTGKETDGLGKGVAVFEPFLLLGQILPAEGFLQVQTGLELPFDRDRAGREAFWRVAAGRTFSQQTFGRSWSPMVELLGARELEQGASTSWDVVPQMQVTLSRRQHVMISGGARIPLNGRSTRRTQLITYLLWDWFDGGFFEGWR